MSSRDGYRPRCRGRTGPYHNRPRYRDRTSPYHNRPQQQGESHYRSGETRSSSGRSIRYLKWKEITELAASTTDQVVDALLTNEAGFLKVFSHSESCSNPRILKALIKIVHLLVISNENSLASRVLGQIYSPDGSCAQFSFQLDQLIKGMPIERQLMAENLNYLQYVIDIGVFGIQKIPTTMLETFPQPAILATIKAFNRSGQDVQKLEKDCVELGQQFDLARDQLLSRTTPIKTSAQDEDNKEPPESFTAISIIPQNEDLVGGHKPFLRPNKVRGPYKGWDHYLDVQFRLLREDFIAPLREGINEHSSDHRSRGIRTYENMHVLAPVCLVSGVGFEISFDTSHFMNIIWEHSRRLIFGSLLCLSNTGFREGPIFFATVVKRDPKQLKEGRLVVKFEGNTSGFEIDPDDEYTMVESTAYFEAYRHVLLALQHASLLKDTMPFKRYIVDCKLHDPSPPLYIRRYNAPGFNLSKVLKCEEADNINVTDENSWPHCKSTCFDMSQYRALKMAMRQEISCIQGPPGTGKTFIGLKIVQTLLQNRSGWDPEKNSPILLVCYTNHALDQFLEEIIDSSSSDGLSPPSIVRIGGRCQSTKLENFVLATIARKALLPLNMRNESETFRREVNFHKANFHGGMPITGTNIFSLYLLEDVISPEHYMQISQGMVTEPRRELEVWLDLWKATEYHEYDDFNDEDEEYEHMHTYESPPRDEVSFEEEMVVVDEEATILQEEIIIEGEEVLVDYEIFRESPKKNRRKRKRRAQAWNTIQISEKEREKRIQDGFRYKPMRRRQTEEIEDVRLLNNKQRWKMYHYWVQEYLRVIKQVLEGPAEAYNKACSDYSQMKREIDCHVARGADIIGMTTTGAAKHHHILNNIHPKIVIIEEAAEVFESHVITSLPPSVQQLILIGDHKQLRPKPNHYELEKKYNLDVSLFQRLIENGIPHVTLTVQHRMRPDIASLIHPAIYPELQNGPRAIEHGEHKIAGVRHNLFFLHHENEEERQNPNESLSHKNIHEAAFMVALCRYLIKQGYKPTQISLLTMYRGQLLEMRSRMKRIEFEGVRVAAVDDFQGEENDIILLSLVRSNPHEDIGFLKIENRVCVALSRAKKGLYVIGNFKMLKKCTIWQQILSVVERKDCIGDALLLKCQNHPQKTIKAKFPADFNKSPEGGCTKPCDYRLKCGHVCTHLCHPWDSEHKSYKCRKLCEKVLPCQHTCRRKCYNCIDGCAPCLEEVEKQIPHCGHEIKMKCCENPSAFPCSAPCQKLLLCGHVCQKLCHESCGIFCPIKVEKVLPCDHSITVACYENVESIKCSVPCNTLLKCEHECQGTCGLCFQGRLHIRCKSKCGRTLVCGHICDFPCSAECPPCTAKCSNYCPHSKCPKNCYEPCDPCAEPCQWNCKHLKCTKKCGELCNRPRCNMPCLKRLKCGHPCIGLCGDKCPKLCRVCDNDKVTEIFFGTEEEPDARFVQLQDCKHVFECTGLDQWMDRNESDEIQFKKCPRCSTLIRTSLRYYNEVKKVHNHFEEIKRKQLQMSNIGQVLMPKLRELNSKGGQCAEVTTAVKKIESLLLRPGTRPLYILPHCLNAIQNQLAILPTIVTMYNELTQVKQKSWQFKDCNITVGTLNQELRCVQKFLMQMSLTDQQLSDIQCEIQRLNCVIRLFSIHSLLKERNCDVTPEDNESLEVNVSQVYYCSGTKGTVKMSEYLAEETNSLITRFKKEYKLEGLTDAERIEIVKATGLSKGRWFKCPNGHYYCIGECGGATEVAKCPECDAKIGGTHHTLLADNAFAPEMDDAAHPAWSDQANMANYNLDD